MTLLYLFAKLTPYALNNIINNFNTPLRLTY